MMVADDELHRAQDSLEAKTRALAQSEAMLQATLESTTDGILVTDEDGRIISCNQNYAQMTGVSSETMASAHYQDVLDVAARLVRDPEAFQARVAEIVTKSPAETYDVLELVDGRVIELFSKVLVVEGRRSGRVWSFRDVTERRHADDARRDETRILEIVNETGVTLSSSLDVRTLLQTVTDATTTLSGARFGAFFYNTVDANGDAYMLYTLSGAPREAFEHLGYPRATALFGPTFRGDAPIRCDDVLADPRYGRMGPHHGMPPGHLPVRSYLAVPVVSRSRDVIGGLFFGHPDVGVFTAQSERIVTGIAAQAAVALDNARLYEAAQSAAEERKQLYEREQDARREAERMSELKDQFLATLSHELRTPLAAILGWAQVLRRGERSQADVHRGLEIIERNARTQTQLIDDLLDMNRIIAGKMQLDVQPVDPVTIIEGALETVRPAAEAKGIRLEKLLDPSTGPVVGDPNRLQQVLVEPALERHQVHAQGRQSAGRAAARGRARRARRRRHRHRHRPGVPAARVRALPASRRVDDATLRRARDRPLDRAATGGAARRDGARRKRRSRPRRDASPSPCPSRPCTEQRRPAPIRRRDRRPHRPPTAPATSSTG